MFNRTRKISRSVPHSEREKWYTSDEGDSSSKKSSNEKNREAEEKITFPNKKPYTDTYTTQPDTNSQIEPQTNTLTHTSPKEKVTPHTNYTSQITHQVNNTKSPQNNTQANINIHINRSPEHTESTPKTPLTNHKATTPNTPIENTNPLNKNINKNKNTNQRTQKNERTAIIIDNVSLKYTQKRKTDELKEIFQDISTDIKFLKKGGIVITTDTPRGINKLLKEENYDVEIFGENIYIHLALDTRPWLCVNKFKPGKNINIIKETIENQKTTSGNIKIEGIHRKKKGQLETSLILFKTTDDLSEQHLLTNSLNIENERYTVRRYIHEQQIRCTNCQKIGHLAKTCKDQPKCVRCAGGKCEKNNCKETFRKCANCGKNHSAAYKNCDALKAHTKGLFELKKNLSFADATKQNIKYINTTQQVQTQENIQLKESITNLQETIKQLTDELKQMKSEIETIKTTLPTIISEALNENRLANNNNETTKSVNNSNIQETTENSPKLTTQDTTESEASFSREYTSSSSEDNDTSLHTRTSKYKKKLSKTKKKQPKSIQND